MRKERLITVVNSEMQMWGGGGWNRSWLFRLLLSTSIMKKKKEEVAMVI